MNQNLLASGEATIATAPAAVAAATAHPAAPLRRAVGSQERFALAPTSLPKIPYAPGIRGEGQTEIRRAVARRRPLDDMRPQRFSGLG